jgi:hypothetical protein
VHLLRNPQTTLYGFSHDDADRENILPTQVKGLYDSVVFLMETQECVVGDYIGFPTMAAVST